MTPRAMSAAPINPKVAGSGTVVATEPDHVLEKMPAVVPAAAATALMVVLLNCPEIASVKNAELSTPDVSKTVPLTVIETVTFWPICDRTNPPIQSCVADGAQLAGTNRFAWKFKFGKAANVSQLLIVTGTPTGKVVNGALGASDMSLIVPAEVGFTAVNVPEPPCAVRVPVPPAAVPQVTDPVDGLPGSVGHQSMKWVVPGKFEKASTPEPVVPNDPVIAAADRLALVIVTINAATATSAVLRQRESLFNFIQFI